MGKNNNGNSWLNVVKKAFRSPTKHTIEKRISRRREETEHEEEEEETKRGKRRWIFCKNVPIETTIQHNVVKIESSPGMDYRENTSREIIVKKDEERRAITMAAAAVATAQATVEIIHLTRPSLFVKEQHAAMIIQAVFRGYLARRALLALKGVVKLQALIRGHNVRKRTKMTLQCIQSLVRVQARVCDQRRRLSYESSSLGSMFNKTNSTKRSTVTDRNTSDTLNDFLDCPCTLEEIQVLIKKAEECSLQQGKTFSHALSQQMWRLDNDNFSDNNYEDFEEHRYSNLQNNTKLRSIHLPKTPSSSKIKSIQARSSSPCYQTDDERSYQRMSTSENICNEPRPNYMAATASAMARVRSHSVPRQRNFSPGRDQTGSAKKRLSFPMLDC